MDIWRLPAGDSGHTWGALRDTFLGSRRSICTARAYAHALHAFHAATTVEPHLVTVVQVQRWLEAMRAARATAATIRARLAALSSWYSFLQRPTSAQGGGLVQANPCRGVPREKGRDYSNPRKIDRATFRRLYDACDDPLDRAWILAYVLTGRRRSELGRLQWEDIETGGEVWYYNYRAKGGRENRRPMPRDVVALLQAWRREHPGAAATGRVWPSSDKAFAGRLKHYARKAGLDPAAIHVHGFRHLAAQLKYEQVGGNIREVSKFLDHADIGITVRYLEALRDDVDDDADQIARSLLS